MNAGTGEGERRASGSAEASGPRRILRVGLTGNIAAGKSTVARRLDELSCHVLDADAISHACMAPGEPAHAEIVEAFGREILDDDGAIDRQRLGARIFTDSEARRNLEAILHPRIRHREEELVSRWASTVSRGITVTEATLLFETGGDARYDRMVVVVAPDDARLGRLRDKGMDEAEARRRMAAQMDQAEKARRADYVVVNDGPPADLRSRAEELWRRLETDLSTLESGQPLAEPDGELPGQD